MRYNQIYHDVDSHGSDDNDSSLDWKTMATKLSIDLNLGLR